MYTLVEQSHNQSNEHTSHPPIFLMPFSPFLPPLSPPVPVQH